MAPRNWRRMLAIMAALVGLSLLSCDPPNFRWPDKIPDVKPVPHDGPTPFDRWKAERLKEKEPTLIAGAAKVDLTPKNVKGTFVAGYQPNKFAMGLGGPITGRVLVLDDGKQTLVLISADFIGLMNDRIWDIRHRISKEHAGDIFFASTHNHASPDTMGMWGRWAFYAIPVESGVNEAYMQRVGRDLANAVLEALNKARPAQLFAADLEVPEGINENSHKFGHKDNMMTVLQARGTNGLPIATLVNYTCHAEFMGQENTKLHHDYPGFLYAELEKREGGVAMFYNGALGGIIVPAMPRRTENFVRLREAGARRAGIYLAGLASQAIRQAPPMAFDGIRIDRRVIALPVDNEIFALLGKKGIFTRDMKDGKLYTEVWRVDLGELSLAGAPGEIFPSLGFAVKALMPSRYKMVACLANDELGYIMDAQDWQSSLYEYERTVSVGPETGTRLFSAFQDLYPVSKQALNETP